MKRFAWEVFSAVLGSLFLCGFLALGSHRLERVNAEDEIRVALPSASMELPRNDRTTALPMLAFNGPSSELEDMVLGTSNNCSLPSGPCQAGAFTATSTTVPSTFSGGANMGGNKITNLAAGVSGSDAATLAQVGGGGVVNSLGCAAYVQLPDAGHVVDWACTGRTTTNGIRLLAGQGQTAINSIVNGNSDATITIQGNKTPSGSAVQCIMTGPSVASNGDTQLAVQNGAGSNLLQVFGSGQATLAGALSAPSETLTIASGSDAINLSNAGARIRLGAEAGSYLRNVAGGAGGVLSAGQLSGTGVVGVLGTAGAFIATDNDTSYASVNELFSASTTIPGKVSSAIDDSGGSQTCVRIGATSTLTSPNSKIVSFGTSLDGSYSEKGYLLNSGTFKADTFQAMTADTTLTLKGNKTSTGSATEVVISSAAAIANGDIALDVQNGSGSHLMEVKGSGQVLAFGGADMQTHKITGGVAGTNPTDFAIVSQLGGGTIQTLQAQVNVLLVDGGTLPDAGYLATIHESGSLILACPSAGLPPGEHALTIGDGSAGLALGSATFTSTATAVSLAGSFATTSYIYSNIGSGTALAMNQGAVLMLDANGTQINTLTGTDATHALFSHVVQATDGFDATGDKVINVANGTASTDAAAWGQVFETVGGYVPPTASPNTAAYYLAPTGTTKAVGLRWAVNNDGTNGGGSTITVQLGDDTASTVLCSGAVNCQGATFGNITCTSALPAGHQFRLVYSASGCAVNPGIYISMQLTH